MKTGHICCVIFILILLIISVFSVNFLEFQEETADVTLTNGPELNLINSQYFTQNNGQILEPEVVFHTKNAYFTPEGVIFRVINKDKINYIKNEPFFNKHEESHQRTMHIFKMVFQKPNHVIPKGNEKIEQISNYIIGNDQSNWAFDIPNYKEIIYKNLYENIDLSFKTTQAGIKYEFVIHPGGELRDIKLLFEGAEVSTDENYNDLIIKTPIGTITDDSLVAYQVINAEEISVEAKICVENNLVQYDIDYNNHYPLIIDPLIYSTFLGDIDEEKGYSIELDSTNNAYVTGYTWSVNFPTSVGAFNSTNNGSTDVFACKLNSAGNNIVYSTYIGGSYNDEARDIVLDYSGNAYIVGFTESLDFPTTKDAYKKNFQGGLLDIFVLKLSYNGASLVYSTYIGGSDYEYGYGIALDNLNNAYITGYTWSMNFPTTKNTFDEKFNGWEDVFVTKLNSEGSDLVYSTYVGGNGIDFGYSIELDSSNNAYVTGYTASLDFPTTTGAFNQTNNGSTDIFVFKLNFVGNNLMYSTYIGGTDDDYGYSITLDSSNNAYVTGWTWSADFPVTSNAYKTRYENWTDIIVFKLNPAGSKLRFSTYIGGSDEDYGYSITLDASNNIFLTGATWSLDFPTTIGAYDPTHNGWEDVFVIILNATGVRLMYSTYVGGIDEDYGYSMALDSVNNAYITGSTLSSNFPTTTAAFDINYNDLEDVLIFKLELPKLPSPPENLTVTVGDGYVLLDWDHPQYDKFSPITNYIIYKGSKLGEFTKLEMIGIADKYNDSSVTNGITYSYAVSSLNTMGESKLSNILDATPGAEPSIPKKLIVTPGEGFIDLAWQPPEDNNGFEITHYSIYRGLNENDLSFREIIGNKLEYHDTNVGIGVIYYYAVTAHNLRGESKWSDVITSATGNPPAAPINLTAEKIGNYVFLNWLEPTDTGGFKVIRYRIYKGTTEFDLILIGETDIISYIDTIEENINIDYYYAVSAINVKGEGAKSEVVSAEPGAIPTAPLVYAIPGEGYIKLVWTLDNIDEAEILYYKIYRGTTSTPLSLIGLTTESEYLDFNVEIDITYSYVVAAENEHGEGLKSNIVSTKPTGYPEMPINVTIKVGPSFVFLKWDPPQTTGGLVIIKYSIYKGENKNGLINIINTTENYYNDTKVMNGITYYYAISAVNEKGEGEKSETLSGTPRTSTGKVRNITIDEDNEKILLSWQPPINQSGTAILWYRLYRGKSEENLSYLTMISATEYNDTSVVNGVMYYYRISAVDDFGEGLISDLVKATPGETPGIPENLKVVVEGGSIILTWNPPRKSGGFEIEGYKIYRGLSDKSMGEISQTQDLIYTDTVVVEGVRYHYKISAENRIGEGECTGVLSTVVGEEIQQEDDTATENIWGIAITIFIVFIMILILIVIYANAKTAREKKPRKIEGPVEKKQPATIQKPIAKKPVVASTEGQVPLRSIGLQQPTATSKKPAFSIKSAIPLTPRGTSMPYAKKLRALPAKSNVNLSESQQKQQHNR